MGTSDKIRNIKPSDRFLDDIDDFEEKIDMEDIVWNLEEIDIITDGLKRGISKEQKKRFKDLAKILLIWFKENSTSLDITVSEYCLEGIKLINKIFPKL